jgi:hypothetical protein
MADQTFDTGLRDPLYTNADLTAANVVELHQPPRPAPYYVPRGTPSYYGYRNGVKVVTLGPGGEAPPQATTRQES